MERKVHIFANGVKVYDDHLTIELEEQETKHQPDGIILASKGVTRL